jgi:hypothetical protein
MQQPSYSFGCKRRARTLEVSNRISAEEAGETYFDFTRFWSKGRECVEEEKESEGGILYTEAPVLARQMKM